MSGRCGLIKWIIKFGGIEWIFDFPLATSNCYSKLSLTIGECLSLCTCHQKNNNKRMRAIRQRSANREQLNRETTIGSIGYNNVCMHYRFDRPHEKLQSPRWRRLLLRRRAAVSSKAICHFCQPSVLIHLLDERLPLAGYRSNNDFPSQITVAPRAARGNIWQEKVLIFALHNVAAKVWLQRLDVRHAWGAKSASVRDAWSWRETDVKLPWSCREFDRVRNARNWSLTECWTSCGRCWSAHTSGFDCESLCLRFRSMPCGKTTRIRGRPIFFSRTESGFLSLRECSVTPEGKHPVVIVNTWHTALRCFCCELIAMFFSLWTFLHSSTELIHTLFQSLKFSGTGCSSMDVTLMKAINYLSYLSGWRCKM